MSTLVDLQHISKSFDGEMVLDDLNLTVPENSFVTLLGPSGCGKTTTLRILGGFTMPDSGKVMFDGQDITYLPPNRRQLNTVFQKYALFPHMSIAENIAFGLKIKGKSKAYIDDEGDIVFSVETFLFPGTPVTKLALRMNDALGSTIAFFHRTLKDMTGKGESSEESTSQSSGGELAN